MNLRVKIFKNENETTINEWLESLPSNTNIHKILQSCTGGVRHISVWYNSGIGYYSEGMEISNENK
tara:strand:+ start:10256 stop:10453 length:198 start_codon:yes stop_codon:yes gene_type:complete